MLVSHKVRLEPTVKQRIMFAKSAGTARFAYNWALAEWKRQYEASDKPNQLALRRQLNRIKREQYPWMLEVSKTCPQRAIINLGDAFDRFFKGKAKFPKFKKKGVYDSFRADNGSGTFHIGGNRLNVPRIPNIKMSELLRFSGEIKSVTISQRADHWYASITVDTDVVKSTKCENQATVGVDFGVKHMAVCSDGKVFDNLKPLRKTLARLRRLCRIVSRRKKGSRNRFKARRRLARCYARVADIRSDTLHKMTTYLVRNYSRVIIEDLNINGMMKNHNLALAIGDVGFGEARRQLDYKTKWYGRELIVADRWFPSSKTCNKCGVVKEKLALSDRIYKCECGNVMDRDLNAAMNLKRYGEFHRNLTPVETGVPVTAVASRGSRNQTVTYLCTN